MTTSVGKTTIGFNNKINNELVNCFGVSFVNRIDDIIEFNKLNRNSIKRIIDISLKRLKEKYKNNIRINVYSSVKDKLINLSNYDEVGARKIEKLVKMYLDSIVIDNILLNKNNVSINKIFN